MRAVLFWFAEVTLGQVRMSVEVHQFLYLKVFEERLNVGHLELEGERAVFVRH